MKILNEQDDIYHYTAEETGLSYEQIKLIESDFWNTILIRLKNPLLEKRDIMVTGFCKFFLSPFKLKYSVEKAKGNRQKFYTKLYEIWQRKDTVKTKH